MAGNKIKKLLLISGRIIPASAQGIRYINLVKEFSKSMEVHHLTFDDDVFLIENCLNYCVKKSAFTETKRKALRFLNKKGFNFFPDEFIFFNKNYFFEFENLNKKNDYTHILIGMTPFSFMELGSLIKGKYPHVNLIADLSDPFSGNADVFSQGKKIRERINWEEKYLILFNKAIVLNNTIQKYYRQLFKDKLNVQVIEQGIDNIYIKETDKKIESINSRLSFIYAGRFYDSFRNPNELFEVFKNFEDKMVLNIYGASSGTNQKNITFKQAVEPETLINKYIASDVIVLFDNKYGMQVPGKTLECIALNKPILFIYDNDQSPTLEYINTAEGVIKCKNNQLEIEIALNDILKKINTITTKFNFLPYTWEALIARYINIIENV